MIDIYYRQLTSVDIPELINLHKEWFPFEYNEVFFNDIVNGGSNRQVLNIGACIKINGIEYIVGSILCEIYKESKENTDKMLPFKYAPFEFCTRSCYDIFCCQPIELCYVLLLGVIDECRKIGLASKLIADLTKKVKQVNPKCKGLYLHVLDYNNAAIKCYIKNGFKELNQVYNYFIVGNKKYDGRIMMKKF